MVQFEIVSQTYTGKSILCGMGRKTLLSLVLTRRMCNLHSARYFCFNSFVLLPQFYLPLAICYCFFNFYSPTFSGFAWLVTKYG